MGTCVKELVNVKMELGVIQRQENVIVQQVSLVTNVKNVRNALIVRL